MDFTTAKHKYLFNFVAKDDLVLEVVNLRLVKKSKNVYAEFKGYVPANQSRIINVDILEKEWKLVG